MKKNKVKEKIKSICLDIEDAIVNYRPPKFVIILFLIIPLSYCIFSNIKGFDNDIWFILNHGRYVLEHGIPHIEPFTMHNGLQFVMQQWLSATIYWIIYKHFGVVGVSLLISIVYCFIIYFFYKICMLISDKKFYLSSILTIIFSICIMTYMVSRPQIFSYLIFLIEFYILELYIKTNNKKYLLVLPLLSLALINLHASMWFMLFIFIIPYIIDGLKINFWGIKTQFYNLKPLLLIVVIMLPFGFINPYGIKAITYIFGSYGIKEINKIIIEMMNFNVTKITNSIWYVFSFLIIFIYIFYRKNKLKIRYFLLYLGTFYLMLSQIKNMSLFILASIFPLADYLKNSFKEYVDKFKTYSLKDISIYKAVCVCALIFIIFFSFKKIPERIFDSRELNEVANYILNNYDKNKIKVYTGYNDGGYLEFKGIKCYMDARAEVFLKANNKKEDIFMEYYQIQYGNKNPKYFLNKYKFDLLVLQKNDALNNYMDNYKLVISNQYRNLYTLK